MLTLEQKQNLFNQLYKAIRQDKHDEIINLLKDVDAEDQVWILTARCNGFFGTLPFLAAVGSSDETFLALVSHLPHSNYVEVFDKLEDGNTPLTEALSWGKASRIKTLLSQVDKMTFEGLLNTKNWEGSSLQELLSNAKSKSGNENLLADIKKIRAEKSFSPTMAMVSLGLHRKVDHKEEQSEVKSATLRKAG